MWYETRLIKHKQNSIMIWKTINEILNRRPKNNTKIFKNFIQANSSNNLDDPKEIANKFNEYFVKVGPNLANTIKQVDNSSFDK